MTETVSDIVLREGDLTRLIFRPEIADNQLAKTKTTGAAVLIEIKTPCTDLLASAYRQDVYAWSAEISGALSQVLQQRSALSRNVLQLREDSDEQLEADMPRCVLLAGECRAAGRHARQAAQL